MVYVYLKIEFFVVDVIIGLVLEVVILGFFEGIELNFSGVKVIGLDNDVVKIGELKLDLVNNM